MTNESKASALAYPKSLQHLEKVQDLTISNWHNSVDSAFDSISRFFHLGASTIDSFNRLQKNNLDLFFERTRPLATGSPESRENELAEKSRITRTGVAVITGGTGGIGTAICRRLSQDNAVVIATYIKPERKQALSWQKACLEEGLEVDLFECDVSDFESCRKSALAIEKKYGRADVLVNCAGITRDAMLKKLEPEDWDAVIDTNLDSIFNVTRNFIDGMLKRGYGRVINISSVNGQKGQFGQTNYSSAKAGMIGFTRSLAVELADKGITVNCVCPGYVGTSMVEAIPDHIKAAIISEIPVGRLATAAEIAHAVGFLAAEDSAYITGTELAVNGGLWTG